MLLWCDDKITSAGNPVNIGPSRGAGGAACLSPTAKRYQHVGADEFNRGISSSVKSRDTWERIAEADRRQAYAKYFRPPEGKFSERCLKYAQQLGLKTIFWSFAYKDWYTDNQPDPDSAFNTIISRTHPGMAALLHATSKTNAEILDRVLTEWENMGYTIKNLNYLVRTYDPSQQHS